MVAAARIPDGLTNPVTFQRDTDTVLIPYGDTFVVPAGTIGSVVQELGGNFVVQTQLGYQVRVAGADAEAIGKDVPTAPAAAGEGSTEDQVWQQLRTVYDPEIPVDIVELGLIYGVDVSPGDTAGRYRVDVQLTLTAPGCGMGQVLFDDVSRVTREVSGVDDVDVELVFDPPWGPDRMSDTARFQLGIDDL